MTVVTHEARSPLLRVHGLSFRRDNRLLFENVSLSIEAGSCTAVIGPNGVGKTTLLRLLAGLLRVQAGTITLAGADLATLTRRQVATQIALVPQQLDVPFDFTVEEIVRLGRHPYRTLFGGMRAPDHKALAQALAATQTTSLSRRKFNEISGGEKQRVKIALGLAQEPRLLLLDEPTQNLDIGRQFELLELIRSLSCRGVTILAAMHDLSLIEKTFSSVILLSPYGPIFQGSPAEVLRPRILERAFDCPPHAQPRLVSDRRWVEDAIV